MLIFKSKLLVSLVILMLVLTACVTPSVEQTQEAPEVEQPTNPVVEEATEPVVEKPTEPVTVKIWTFLNPDNTSPREVVFKQIIDQFELDNPNVTILVEPQPYREMGPKWLAQMELDDKTAADILWLDIGIGLEAANRGFLADLNPLFLDDWSEEDQNDFFLKLLERGKYGTDSQYSLGVWPTGGYMLYARADWLEEAGAQLPIETWTWDEFIEIAQNMTKDVTGDGIVDQWGLAWTGTAPFNDMPVEFKLLEAEGGLWDDSCKALYDTPSGFDAMQFQVDLVNKFKVTPPEIVTYSLEDAQEQFVSGRYGMIINTTGRFSTVKGLVTWDKEDLVMLPWPTDDGSQTGPVFLEAWDVGVRANSPVVKEAAKFVEALFSKEAALLWAEVGGQLPNRPSVISDDFFSQPANQYLKVIIDSINNWSYVRPGCNQDGYLDDLGLAYQEILVNNVSIEEAMTNAAKAFNDRQE